MLYKKATRVPIIKNGANGTSVFIFIFFEESNSKETLTIAPIQNDNVTAVSAVESPSIQPIPSTSFASPRPIHAPRDTNHKRANGEARIGPANTFINVGKINIELRPVLSIKSNKNEIRIKA